MTPSEFKRCLPFETFEFVKARIDVDRSNYKRSICQAWYTAAFQRQKKLPDLQKFLRESEGPESVEEMRRKIKMTAMFLGGKLENG